jgi:hypothetical protein
VKSTVGTEVMVSNVVGIVITPYTTESPKLYLLVIFEDYGEDWTNVQLYLL